MKNKDITIAGYKVSPGEHAIVTLPSADLYTQTEMGIPVHVFNGKKAGPHVFITSAIHGDELNSIEIIRRLHLQKWIRNIKGTLITIPVVNIYGFILQSRYLPDRRDLNRSFPGSKKGSLAARLASTLIEEIISQCQYGIDLHTGAYGRSNLPQLRVNLATPGTKQLAKAFDVPVIIDAEIRDGSLRQAANELGIPVLVYEGGEALRLREMSVRMGLRGIINVLNYLGMIKTPTTKKLTHLKPLITNNARWVRASVSGMLQPTRDFTESFVVKKGEILAHIHDPFLMNPSAAIKSPFNGVVIGIANLPVVNEGDAVYNIASVKKLKNIKAYIEDLRDEIILHY
ncbi:MAG: succinylglutamate desuccinylase/aspartoacylase family protein [Candidatus Berkiellales bacterium]